MLKIDNSLLVEVGLGSLPEAEKNGFLKHIYETLEMRVGIRLADQMSNDQLDEFERYFEAKDDAGAFKWLETNFPNYKDIVQEEFDKLKTEVAQTAPQILATSQAGAAQPTPIASPTLSVPPTVPVAPATPMPSVTAMPSPIAPASQPAPAQFQAPQTPPVVGSTPSIVPPPASVTPMPAPLPPVPQPIPPPLEPNPLNPAPPYPVEQPPAGPSPAVST
jgi:hypothetical protein